MTEVGTSRAMSPVVPPGPVRSRLGRASCALLYLLILGGLLATTDLHESWTFDDGAYATQVRVLDRTDGWAYPYRWAERDPTSTFAPVSHSVVTDDASYPYVKRPAWILVLRAGRWAAGGDAGLFVAPVLGAVLAALVGWTLAERLRPGTGLLGFWSVALGPILVHTSAMWAHTWAAALGGLLAVVIVDRQRRVSARWHLPALVLVPVVLVSLRTDGLLVAAAAALVLGLLAAREVGVRDRARALAVGSVPVSIAALGAHLANGWWAARLAPGPWRAAGDVVLTDLSFAASRWTGFLCTFLAGSGSSDGGNRLAGIVVLCWLLAGALGADRRRPLAAGIAFGLGLALLAYRVVVVAPFDLGGALVALPLVPFAVGVALRRAPEGIRRWSRQGRRRPGMTPTAALVAFATMVTLAVIATQYPEGGSADWGGRFLFGVLVPVSVVTALAVDGLLADRTQGASRHRWIALLAVAVAVPTCLGWFGADGRRSAMTELTATIEAPPGVTVVRIDRHLTRGAWRLLPEHDVLSADPGTVDDALRMLRPGRTEPVLVVGDGAGDLLVAGYDRVVPEPGVAWFTPG